MTKVTVKNFTLKRQGQCLFKQVNHDFKAGEMVLLMGDTGSGKSTLLYLLAGLLRLDYEGQLVLDGKEYQELTTSDILQKVGLVFQNPSQQFTMKTLRREMYFALENQQVPVEVMSERVELAVKQARVADLLDQPLNTLSGGEKQRAALAVLLVMSPDIILLDEPFASVDPFNRKKLIHLLKELAQAGKTIIITDHDSSDYAAVIDELIILKDQQFIRKAPQQLVVAKPQYQLTNPCAKTTPILALQGVRLAYKNKVLLQKSDSCFKKGITTITGANGSGKSTLLKALVQQQKYQGKMFYQGKRLRKRRYIYQWLTLVVQEATKQYVAVTVEKELQFSPPKSPQAKARYQAALSDLGIDQWLSKSVYHLSGGQQKILQLVTMLSLDVPLLLLDEPFTGLDEATCQYFMAWIKALSSEKDIIIVSHRLAPLDGLSDHHIELANQTLTEVLPLKMAQQEVVCDG